MDCKKALGETNCDLDEAIALLRKKGAASAEKKAGRIAAEGVVQLLISEDASRGTLLEVNCETDFVAKDDSFNSFVAALTQLIVDQNPADVESLSALIMDSGASVEAERHELIAKIGENISIRRF